MSMLLSGGVHEPRDIDSMMQRSLENVTSSTRPREMFRNFVSRTCRDHTVALEERRIVSKEIEKERER